MTEEEALWLGILKTLTDSEELQCVGHWDSDLADGSESEE